MTTIDRYEEFGVADSNAAPEQDDAPIDFGTFMDEIQSLAAANPDGPPVAMAAGTFVFYPMLDGGLMLVFSIVDGPMAGEKRMRVAPGMIRAAAAFAGGSKLGALKALAGGGRKRGKQP